MNCPNDAKYKFYWPGSPESYICEEHVAKLRGVAAAMGIYVEIKELEPGEMPGQKCNQKTSNSRTPAVDRTPA